MWSAILLCLAAAVLIGAASARLLRRLRPSRPDPQVRWLRPDESPLGRRVVDCRGYCQVMPGPPHDKIAERFAATRRAPVARLRGQLPEGADPEGKPLGWRFNEGELKRIRAGFPASDIEDRWLIRRDENRIYFQRSLTGALVYVLSLLEEGGGGRADRLWIRRSEQESEDKEGLNIAIAQYLIDSHLLGRTAAVPVPAELASEPQKMALFAFSIAGRRGEYAEPCWPFSPDQAERN